MTKVPPTIETRSVSGGYGRTNVLSTISIHVAPSEAVALLGRNGTGKSTLFRALTSMLPRRQGQLLLHGDDVSSQETWQLARRGIAHVLEERRVLHRFTVDENLRLAERGRPGRDSATRIRHVLQWFPELETLWNQRGSQLSGGEQQILAISRALLMNPTALLLDEATEGLSPAVMSRLELVMKDLRGRGVAILLAERNLRFVRRVVDRCYILDRGSVVAELPLSDLHEDNEWVRRYVTI